jgi:hypothetical protein
VTCRVPHGVSARNFGAWLAASGRLGRVTRGQPEPKPAEMQTRFSGPWQSDAAIIGSEAEHDSMIRRFLQANRTGSASARNLRIEL